ncbi:hypothetical protein EYF80_008043 [Liparis tanakae]|uniref:Uncharacterized protein n=1 Tax=Liparis tanakae TaxID=230148 RepID=A0A4Z2IV26_9TELE|nr:hypothetical protein EYF80_008043 [Liparis tanakae]
MVKSGHTATQLAIKAHSVPQLGEPHEGLRALHLKTSSWESAITASVIWCRTVERMLSRTRFSHTST